MTLREALDRTLLLMRDEFDDSVSDSELLEALTGTEIAVVADESNISSHSAQTAFVTAAMLMARSGHRVYLMAPDVPLACVQPPLQPGAMIEQLLKTGSDMLPDVAFIAAQPATEIDLAIAIGNSPIAARAQRRVRLNADAWTAYIAHENDPSQWRGDHWPIGAMGSAAFAAGEAFKFAMRKLRGRARNPERMETVFADTIELTFPLAPYDTPLLSEIGCFDCISGGAIIDAALYSLARIPSVRGRARVIEHDLTSLSNLNRYMLLLRSRMKSSKAEDLAAIVTGGLDIKPVPMRFEASLLDAIGPLAPVVLVGVDDIPSRWAVQQANPEWLAIGATTHWSAMASIHEPGRGCAQCLHPEDEPGNAPIPTVAFVSFWAGLLTAAYFLRHLGGKAIPTSEEQIYLTPFRGENAVRSSVPIRRNCPTCTPHAGH